MLVTLRKLMKDAREKGYAVPSINTQGGNYDIIRACVEAAEEANSPMILAMHAANVNYYGTYWFAKVALHFAEMTPVPVAIHLDHADTFDACMRAIKCGFTSVMLDCSKDSIDDNIRKTNQIIRCAHAVGISVEAEIGELQRVDADGVAIENKNIASVEDVKRFATNCRPDVLAVGIGNAHGFHTGEPDIRLDVLEAIRATTDIPLALHDSTGMAEEVVRNSIDLGINKINFDTLVRHRYMEHYKEGIETLEHKDHSWMVAKYAEEKLKTTIQDIITLVGSAERFGEGA